MPGKFHELTGTAAVRAARAHYYSDTSCPAAAPTADALTTDEVEFIARRDSFYLATVGESGWPYLQHRGGTPGFLRVLGANTLAFADYGGNRQLLSVGNLAANDRAALFLMDYPSRQRLKILGHARVEAAQQQPDLAAQLADSVSRRVVERIFFVEVAAYDWNCPQHITPRFTAEEIRAVADPLRRRIAELEAQLAARSELS